MDSLHKLSLDQETICIITAVTLFGTQNITQNQLTVPLENIRKQHYGFSVLVSNCFPRNLFLESCQELLYHNNIESSYPS